MEGKIAMSRARRMTLMLTFLIGIGLALSDCAAEPYYGGYDGYAYEPISGSLGFDFSDDFVDGGRFVHDRHFVHGGPFVHGGLGHGFAEHGSFGGHGELGGHFGGGHGGGGHGGGGHR
ncbi:MAG TPA: hypothetical protein VFR21_09265 [Bradyrhizobium sp.]|nr:hypothetical protein [Bradyrhizobium sp.]